MSQVQKQAEVGKSITIKTLMRDKYFNLGFRDFTAGRGFHKDYETPYFNRWNYERGRQFAAATNSRYKPRLEGNTLNVNAVYSLANLINNGSIS